MGPMDHLHNEKRGTGFRLSDLRTRLFFFGSSSVDRFFRRSDGVSPIAEPSFGVPFSFTKLFGRVSARVRVSCDPLFRP